MAKRISQQQYSSKTTLDFDGRSYSVQYTVESGRLTLTCEYGSKAAELTMAAPAMAYMLFIEIMQDARARGRLKANP